jgi:hypothetical protein
MLVSTYRLTRLTDFSTHVFESRGLARRDSDSTPNPATPTFTAGVTLSVGDCQMTANTLKITCPKGKKENAIPLRVAAAPCLNDFAKGPLLGLLARVPSLVLALCRFEHAGGVMGKPK